LLDNVGPALKQVFGGIPSARVEGQLDRLLERAARAGRQRQARERLVEVQVRIDQARKDECAGGIQFPRRSGRQPWGDRLDLTARDRDIVYRAVAKPAECRDRS
jgi:hypothetical protein